jgi:DNA-binding LytR/AlgR family response regulator
VSELAGLAGLTGLVVEDEARARSYLEELLRGTGAFARVVGASTAADATRALVGERFDVAFVDIRLVDRPGDTSGLDWARGVAGAPSPPRLVFTTAMPEHALAAFETGAVDYLLKPFTPRRVGACVQRLIALRAPAAAPAPALASPAAAAASEPRLVARTASGLVLMAIDGVLAFEAAERLTYVHHADGRFLVDPSLAALEQQLGRRLLRCHRNWLVAPRHVRRLDRRAGELVLVIGDALVVPVARDRAAEVRQALVAGTIGLDDRTR